jgi:dinuclear metal center YbgI/SA1388 family protein
MTTYQLKTIISSLEKWAPKSLAESYDNPGLQIGHFHHEVKKVLLAVDVDSQVLDLLNEQSYQLIVTHHPLLFKPLSCINTGTAVGRIIEQFIKKDIALYSMHTNLDIAPGGVNDCLIQAFGFDPAQGKLIRPRQADIWYKVSVYIPCDQLETFRSVIFKQFPSQIGQYQCCSFASSGEGTFLPLEAANPSIGQVGNLEKVAESKLEFLIKKDDLGNCVDFIKRNHPYEEPAYDVFEEKIALQKIAVAKYFKVSKGLDIADLINKYPCRLRGQVNKGQVQTIAFACGSARHLLDDLINLEIDCLITGEIDYHSALTCELNNIAVIELGHLESEEFVLPQIQQRLAQAFPQLQIDIFPKLF